jgi:hypothetical protein
VDQRDGSVIEVPAGGFQRVQLMAKSASACAKASAVARLIPEEAPITRNLVFECCHGGFSGVPFLP